MRALLENSLALWRLAAADSNIASGAAAPEPCALHLPPFGRTFTPAEQASRVIHLDRLLDSVERELRLAPRTSSERAAARRRLTLAFSEFAQSCLDFGPGHLDLLLNGFSSVGTDLARQAREFDPGVAAADIFQASRNAWTACGLQVLMGRDMFLTPAIFAYSMLYPYTDNYLDDPAVSAPAKLAFSRRFRCRLEGDSIAPVNARESVIFRLVELIEDQYPRAESPNVYAALLEIHRAQEHSLQLLRLGAPDPSVDVLRLSFEKGGASVLADACLVAGSLAPDEAQFAFDWGVLLQLGDDLQDVQQDLREGILTIFSQAASAPIRGPLAAAPLDPLATRVLNFGHHVMRGVDRMPSSLSALPGTASKHRCLAEMIRMSCELLLIWSAADSPAFFTAPYLAALEAHSPFRFAPLAERRRKLARWTAPLSRLFESFLEDEEDEPASLLLASSLMRF